LCALVAGLSARVSATLIALVLLLLAGTAGAADKQPGVYVVGDSLASGTAPYLRQQLAGWRLTQIVSIGLHTAQGAELVRERSRSLPEVVVVSLGTNDDPRLVSRFAEDVRAVVAAAGPRRCVVWPTIVRPPAVGASYVGYNVTLKHVAARHENLVVVDWVGLVRRHPAWLGRDGIHVKPAGYRARAAAIAGAVERCP
jgi:lysophospholipase L1-like esterase